MERWPAARTVDSVEVEGYPIRIKVSPGRIKVEHDDAARVARLAGLPLREVLSRAEAAGRSGLRVVEEQDSPGDYDQLEEASDHAHPNDHGHPHDHDGPDTA
jgi:hypothetical protein